MTYLLRGKLVVTHLIVKGVVRRRVTRPLEAPWTGAGRAPHAWEQTPARRLGRRSRGFLGCRAWAEKCTICGQNSARAAVTPGYTPAPLAASVPERPAAPRTPERGATTARRRRAPTATAPAA